MATARPEYISLEGWTRLNDELDQLHRVERPTVVNNVAAAAAEGDRSENAEYIYGKKRLREIDKRIEFLRKRVEGLTPVKAASTAERVVFLSYVRVEDAEGELHEYRIVGADETDARTGAISVKSPVGRALVGKRLDDEVFVRTPGGLKELTIIDIGVEPLDPAD